MNELRIAALALLVLGATASAEVTIEVQSEAMVSGAVVRLGHVALIEGDQTGALRSLVVCPSPLAGESRRLPQDRIRRRVSALLAGEGFTLAGAAECRIARPETATSAAVVLSAPAQPAVTVGNTLETHVRRFVMERLSLPTGSVRIEFDVRDREVLALTDDRCRFKILSATNRMDPGSQTVRVEVYDVEQPRLMLRSCHVRFEVVLLEDVVVVARSCRTDHVLTAEDVTVERREFREQPRVMFREAADVIGATVRRNIGAGQILNPEDLKKTLFVRRGDAVTVRVCGRGFTIKTVSRALEDGEMGSAVAVQGKDGQGKFYATVVGPRTVELRLAGAGRPAGEAGEAGPVADAAEASANKGER